MDSSRFIRRVKLSMARMSAFRQGNVRSSPAFALRDLWKGDSTIAAQLLKGELLYANTLSPFSVGKWGDHQTPLSALRYMHSFAWLRDMRELGTDGARLLTRSLISDWISRSSSSHDVQAYQIGVIGDRLAHWLGHYDFFGASADDHFRQQFMNRVMSEGRMALAMLPPEKEDHHAFALLKGTLSFLLCMPDYVYLVPKIQKYLEEELAKQILDDGTHIERNPEIQFRVLRDLVEIRLMLQIINIPSASSLISTLDSMSRVLRSLRHSDGGLALFNGATEQDGRKIETVLSQATPKRLAMTKIPNGGYMRCHVNRATLLVDCGVPPPVGWDSYVHASALSMEFSMGKQRIFVNCGSSLIPEWRKALKLTAAHSVLVLEDTDSINPFEAHNDSDFQVKADHRVVEGAHLLELSHNGWEKKFGATYSRTIYLSADGEDIRGQECIEADKPLSFVIRFHLHPTISVIEETTEIKEGETDKIIVLISENHQEGRQIWWFRYSGAVATVEDSVYWGSGAKVATKQIVLYVSAEDDISSSVNVEETKSDNNEENTEADSKTLKDNSDYVAVFHNQNPGEDPDMQPSNTGENQETSETEELLEPKGQIVRWALHRKI